MEDEMPPAKKLKTGSIAENQAEGSSGLNGNEVPEPDVYVAVSPKTVPILPPEMWAHIFEDFPSKDLETVMNTCPEWNKLLSFQKPSVLFPRVLQYMRGWLPKDDLLTFRLVNKACKGGVDLAHPENLPIIAARQERERQLEALRLQVRYLIQSCEEYLVGIDYRIGVANPNQVIRLENKRDDLNRALIDLRERLQSLN